MGGQSTLGQGKVLEEGPSAQPRARPGPVSMKKASLKVFVSDENPIPLKKKKSLQNFFFLLKMKIALLSSTEMIYSFTI